jgi:SAM-dependent methyltransferase
MLKLLNLFGIHKIHDNAFSAGYWERKYIAGQTKWDNGKPSPALVNFLELNSFKPGKIAVLGCGYGHDALLLSRYGFDVTGFDFAPSAIAHAQSLAKQSGLPAQFLLRNIFQLSSEFSGYFDYIWENGCFCSISSTKRSDYVKTVYSLLKPNSYFLGLFLVFADENSLPFGIEATKIVSLFSNFFEQPIKFELTQDIPKCGKGKKLLVILKVKK